MVKEQDQLHTKPTTFVQQLDHGRLPAEAVVFPDAFEDVRVKGAYPYGLSSADSERRTLELAPSSSRFSVAKDGPHHRTSSSLGSSDREVSSKEMRTRGVHEALRVSLKQRTKERIALQETAGQFTVQNSVKKAAKPVVFGAPPSAEHQRRQQMRDYPHARWVCSHSTELANSARRREDQMQSLRQRRLENLEMETYCGTQRSRKEDVNGGSRHRTPSPHIDTPKYDTSSDTSSPYRY